MLISNLGWIAWRCEYCIISCFRSEFSQKGEITSCTKDAERAFFIVGGVAALTLIINATLVRQILYELKLVVETSEEYSAYVA
jgi:hypothetical protein